MCQSHGQDGGQAAQDYNDQRITAGVPDGRVRSTEKTQQGRDKQPDQERIQKSNSGRSVYTESTDTLGLIGSVGTHQARDKAPAADAEQVGQRHIHHDKGQCDRGSGHHIGIACAADKEGIHHVVDQIDQLADDGGYCHGEQGTGHGRFGKQCALVDNVFLHGSSSLFCLQKRSGISAQSVEEQ